ncbi:MAG: DNA cytosine methyltransferase [Candidatus Hermodarchaeota archaeon]
MPDHLKPEKMNHFKDKFRRLSAQKPSPTLVAQLKFDSNRFIHPFQDRGITAREAARIQSIPDNFVFYVSRIHQLSQIGNAVPFFVSKVLAKFVRKMLLS